MTTLSRHENNDIGTKTITKYENGVSDGVMFDRVSGKLFRNAWTGAFVIGPDKVSASGVYECLTPRRSYRRFSRPSAWFCVHSQEWDVAA